MKRDGRQQGLGSTRLSSTAFPGPGPEDPSGATHGCAYAALAPLRFHAARQTRGLYSARSVSEAGFPSWSGSSPKPSHQDSTALVPPSPSTSFRLGNNCPSSPLPGRENRPIRNTRVYKMRTLNGRSRTPTDPTAWPGAH